MLHDITLYTAFLFAILYPLVFLLSVKDPLKNNFHHFHLALPAIVGGLVLIFIYRLDAAQSAKIIAYIWYGLLIAATFVFWKKEFPQAGVLAGIALLGVYAFVRVYATANGGQLLEVFVWVLSGMIFTFALYAMNLGHWYLNVHGLPFKHLENAVFMFWFFVAVRILLDAFLIFTSKVLYSGEEISILNFIMKMDGFLLLVGIFFGTLFPLVALYFANETVKLKNTQSATGILYVILCSVLFGDIAYKYYLLKFGVFL